MCEWGLGIPLVWVGRVVVAQAEKLAIVPGVLGLLFWRPLAVSGLAVLVVLG